MLLALVALATLTPVYAIDAQDVSRVCLTRSLVHLEIRADGCLDNTFAVDKSTYGGHLYSDKAPGMSVLEIPGVVAAGVPTPPYWALEDIRLWYPRVLASGLAFLLCAFLVGRMSEGLAPGYGGLALIGFALGTLAGPLAAANFEHDTAGMLGLAAFALAWRRRPHLAGLVAGAALLVAYEEAMVIVILGAYVTLQGGRALLNFARGVLPGAALLWTYNWLAFGAPWHFSYDYIAGSLATQQAQGFFGVHLPYAYAARVVFVGRDGLLPLSPIVLAGGYGLWRLARRYRAEALVAAAVCVAFVLLDCGYFDPYGGVSPGPRFLAPALPFLALGLGPAFARRFRPGVALLALSVLTTTAMTLTWMNRGIPQGSIWPALVHLPSRLGSSPLVAELSSNVVVFWLHGTRGDGAILVVCAALAALALALLDVARRGRGARQAA